MRVVSLVPAATEMVSALGAEHLLVGISHECDYPPTVRHLPRVTTTPIDVAAPSGGIDLAVKTLREAGRAVITVDGAQLQALRPDLILTQDLCDVCAITDGSVRSLGQALEPPPRLLALEARTLAGIFQDINAVGAALERPDDAEELVLGLEHRLTQLRGRGPPKRPRVVSVEWLDPLYLAGHWVPEMIETAGGVDVGAAPGSHSARRSWSEVAALRPDVVIVALCGFGVERTSTEWERFMAGGTPDSGTAAEFSSRAWVLDGNAYTSRPGPRVVDGAERIQAALVGREMPGLRRVSR